MIKRGLISEEIESRRYWFSGLFPTSGDGEPAYLLPSYDEFIISYKDRSAVLSFEKNKKAVSGNGIFRPVIVVRGEVIGIWKRTEKKANVLIEIEFFKKPSTHRKPDR